MAASTTSSEALYLNSSVYIIKTEDCKHVLTCKESNCVDCLLKSIDRLDTWLGGAGHGATAPHGPCLVCK